MHRKIAICILIIVFITLILSGCFENEDNQEQLPPSAYQIYIENKGGYETIQEAIIAADNDDTINILQGIYSEMLIINKSINLIGESKDTTFIVIQESSIESGNIISINADNCTITELSIIGNSSSGITGIAISSSNNTITNVAISNTSRGIYLKGYANSKNNNIYQNTISNNKEGIYSTPRSGKNNISANNIFSNSKYGMFIQSDNSLISKNKIYNNDIGIRLKSSKSNNVFKNEFNNNSNKGLYICCGTEKNFIYNNSFINNLIHVDYTVTNVNYFYKKGYGNYWDDYLEQYTNATQLNGIWDVPYKIQDTEFEDKYPLVKPIEI